jgi:hypothetical protein
VVTGRVGETGWAVGSSGTDGPDGADRAEGTDTGGGRTVEGGGITEGPECAEGPGAEGPGGAEGGGGRRWDVDSMPDGGGAGAHGGWPVGGVVPNLKPHVSQN